MSNNTPQQLNTPTYTIAIDNTSKAATLIDKDIPTPNWIITNLSTTAVFVVSGQDSAPTAVFPTSATVPLDGKVIPAGFSVTYGKNPLHKYISAIQSVAGVGNLYISPGAGE